MVVMNVMNGTELLAAYLDAGSEDAFSELVRRYTNLVYSVAKRQLSISALAEDVTQTVFTRLAKSAPKLKSDAALVAWLHRTTLHVAIDAWRSESRRRTREEQTIAMEAAPADSPHLWDEIAPNLDEALNQLGETDRHAVLLRFFDRKPMREIGVILGVSEDAAKMRVSRAVDRLRAQLAARGVACTAAALAAFLPDRALEAAPANLVARLAAVRFPRVETGIGAGILASLLLVSKGKLATGAVVLVTIAISFVVLLRSARTAPDAAASGSQIATADAQSGGSESSRSPRVARRSASSAAALPTRPRCLFRVVDAETGAPLPNAKIRAVYFYAGGRGEPHELVTDENGVGPIPESAEPNAGGPNVFVTAEGHVPKVIGFRDQGFPAEYTMRLHPARTVSGMVVDQDGQPVAGVSIRVQRAEDYKHGAENVDFQTSPVTTDANGRWTCTYIPKHYQEIRFILMHDDYAVTLPIVPVGRVDLNNLLLVIERGFTVAGRITGSDGHPIRGAEIRELNNTGYRQQSATTDYDGAFILKGVRQFDSWRSPDLETNAAGRVAIRGLIGQGQPYVSVVVQAQGFAPVSRQIQLRNPTTILNLALAPGRLFRGRVLDQSGNPIPNAAVRTDSDDQGLRKFIWMTHTDAAGRFEWDSAPAEPVLFWFEAPGFTPLRDVSLVADGTDHEIRLSKSPNK